MGHRIRARRERAGLSQDELGKQVGATQSTVGKWELGSSVPRWPTMWTLGEVLGVSPRWLVEPLVLNFGEVESDEDAHDPAAGAS